MGSGGCWGVLQDLAPRVSLLQEGFHAGCWFVAPGCCRAGICVSLCQTTCGGEMAAAFGAPEVLRGDQRAAESSGIPANPLLPPWQKKPTSKAARGPWDVASRSGTRQLWTCLSWLPECAPPANHAGFVQPIGRAVGAGSEGEHWSPGPVGAWDAQSPER